MTRTPGNYLKIFGLTVLLSALMCVVIYIALGDERDYFLLVVFILFALLIFGLFLKSDPRFKVLAWSMIWTTIIFVALGLFAFIFLLTYGPHGVC